MTMSKMRTLLFIAAALMPAEGFDGSLEPLLLRCIQHLAIHIPPGSILDAGANDGSGTAQLARAFPQHKVVGIEPTRVNIKRARQLIAGLPNAHIVRGVLSDRTTTLSYPPGREFRAGVLSQVSGSDLQPSFGGHRNNITAYSVDDFMLQRGQVRTANCTARPRLHVGWGVAHWSRALVYLASLTCSRQSGARTCLCTSPLAESSGPPGSAFGSLVAPPGAGICAL